MTKTNKLRKIKYDLIERMEDSGYINSDEGCDIVFSNDVYHVWFRPSHKHVLVTTQRGDSNSESNIVEIDINNRLDIERTLLNL